MAEINLLPSDLAPNKAYVKLSSKLKKISLVLFIFFMVFAASGAAAMVILFRQQSTLTKHKEELVAGIKALEATEQKIVLIKDRIGKTTAVYSYPNITGDVEKVNTLVTDLEGVDIAEFVSGAQGNTLKIGVADSVTLSAFLEKLIQSGLYKNVTLNSLSYQKQRGIGLDLNLAN